MYVQKNVRTRGKLAKNKKFGTGISLFLCVVSPLLTTGGHSTGFEYCYKK